MQAEPISPALVACHLEQTGELPELTDVEWMTVAFDGDFWLRPDQWEPPGEWVYWGAICGRGYGKSTGFVHWINRRVEQGHIRKLGLIAQDEDRSLEVQVQPLIDAAPPWFKPVLHKGDLVWPDGARGVIYTPESPEKIRGFNGDAAWCSEFVGWAKATRWDAFTNLMTAVREGNAQVLWDTTSKGRNEIIEYMVALNEEDPEMYPITRGTIWDNPVFTKHYLRGQYKLYNGRRFEEELEGKVFRETQGALWQQDCIDMHRRYVLPKNMDLILFGLDPAISVREGTDDTGLVVGGRDTDGEIYTYRDRSGKHTPEQYASICVEEYLAGAAGGIVETNRGGMTIVSTIRAVASKKGIDVRVLQKGQRFPRRVPGIMYIREIHSRGTKFTRAGGPAALQEQGRVHHVGELTELEYEQTTYEPGTAESPNRYDASNMVVTELAELESNKPSPAQRKARVGNEAQASGALRRRLAAIGRGRSVV